MRFPSHSVEVRRSDRFKPPHCPRRDCPDHRPKGRYRFTKEGSFKKKSGRRRRVPCYRCRTCKSYFSLQSFACTYYMKRPELLPVVAALLVAGCAHRQIAMFAGCAPSTVTRMAARIGRHSLLL